MGSRRSPRSLWNKIFNWGAARLIGRSGRQLLLEDAHGPGGRPLLAAMSEPAGSFVQGLSLFEHRVLYANAVNDITVPYCTAAIACRNPYRDPPSAIWKAPSIAREFPHIVRVSSGAAGTCDRGECSSGAGRAANGVAAGASHHCPAEPMEGGSRGGGGGTLAGSFRGLERTLSHHCPAEGGGGYRCGADSPDLDSILEAGLREISMGPGTGAGIEEGVPPSSSVAAALRLAGSAGRRPGTPRPASRGASISPSPSPTPRPASRGAPSSGPWSALRPASPTPAPPSEPRSPRDTGTPNMAENEEVLFRADAKREALVEMYRGLNSIPWTRVDVRLPGPTSHGHIVVRVPLLNSCGADVVEHIVRVLAAPHPRRPRPASPAWPHAPPPQRPQAPSSSPATSPPPGSPRPAAAFGRWPEE
eukprot:tig00020934_g16103.t1